MPPFLAETLYARETTMQEEKMHAIGVTEGVRTRVPVLRLTLPPPRPPGSGGVLEDNVWRTRTYLHRTLFPFAHVRVSRASPSTSNLGIGVGVAGLGLGRCLFVARMI